MKCCASCHDLLPPSSFSSRRNGRQTNSYCKSCQRLYCKAHYRRNSQLHNQRRRLNQARYRKRNRSLVMQYLGAHPCVDCGEGDIRVLEFDHVRGQKLCDISKLVCIGAAWQRISAEIAKCEVRCANCHRRRTVEQFGWPTAIGA